MTKVLYTAKNPWDEMRPLSMDHVTQEFVDALNVLFDSWPENSHIKVEFAAGEVHYSRREVKLDPETFIGKTVKWLPDQNDNVRRAVAVVDGGVLVSVPGTASSYLVVPAGELVEV